jgi:hypothetical protein
MEHVAAEEHARSRLRVILRNLDSEFKYSVLVVTLADEDYSMPDSYVI